MREPAKLREASECDFSAQHYPKSPETLRKPPMRIALPVLTAIALTACAGAGTVIQTECESTFREFPEIFQCTYEGVASRNPEILQDDRAKLYLLRGEQLAAEVLEKKISSLDAKIAWQRLYVELKEKKEQETVAALGAISKSLEAARSAGPPPRTTTAIIMPHPAISCRSTKLGTTIYTTCD